MSLVVCIDRFWPSAPVIQGAGVKLCPAFYTGRPWVSSRGGRATERRLDVRPSDRDQCLTKISFSRPEYQSSRDLSFAGKCQVSYDATNCVVRQRSVDFTAKRLQPCFLSCGRSPPP